MKLLTTIMAGAALALSATAATAADPAEKGEARLAKMLEGRVAGEPVTELAGQPVQGVALGHYSRPWPSADSGSGGRFPVFS